MADSSPFAGLSVAPPLSGEAGIDLAERGLLAKQVLRGDAADPVFKAAAEGALGLTLPRAVGQGAEAGGIAILCRGPDEWLVLGAAELADGLVATEVSAAWALLHLSGAHALDLLAKGCALDLHGLADGHGRESQLAQVHVIVRRSGAGFDLLFRRSHARAAWKWLADAAGEYGLRWTPLAAQEDSS